MCFGVCDVLYFGLCYVECSMFIEDGMLENSLINWSFLGVLMFFWKFFEIIELLFDMFVVIMLEMKYWYNKVYCFYLYYFRSYLYF